jgi:hypothetical protein
MTTSHKSERLGWKSGGDEAAIRALYQQMIDGWNAGNGDDLLLPIPMIVTLLGLTAHT